jgi:Bacterial TniB protein
VEMEVRALLILKQLKVRVIVIDEVHNLLAGSPRERGWAGRQPTLRQACMKCDKRLARQKTRHLTF